MEIARRAQMFLVFLPHAALCLGCPDGWCRDAHRLMVHLVPCMRDACQECAVVERVLRTHACSMCTCPVGAFVAAREMYTVAVILTSLQFSKNTAHMPHTNPARSTR